METKLINIGNSKGILIPAKILKLLGFEDKVRIAIEDNKMIIEPIGEEARADSLSESIETIPDDFEDEDFDDRTW